MSDELAQALANVLAAVEAYDKEQPVQTRLATKHAAMRDAMVAARAALATRRARMLDGEPPIEYKVTLPEGEPVYPKVEYRDTWGK